MKQSEKNSRKFQKEKLELTTSKKLLTWHYIRYHVLGIMYQVYYGGKQRRSKEPPDKSERGE